MKTIILYCNRNVGIAALCYLKARGYDVLVITEDENVEWMARNLGVPILPNVAFIKKLQFDLFLCVHGRKIIAEEHLVEKKMVNVHPCLFKYKGHNPIKRYIFNHDTEGSVESHWLTKDVDEGELIYDVRFNTGICKTYAEFYNEALRFYFLVISKTLDAVL